MMRVMLLTLCAVAMPILDSVPGASGDRDWWAFSKCASDQRLASREN